ncbi:MAG: filamentous hemagglutinin N-terminal domain-containing protein, partial [Campylobacteraceae bacterium]|nr:filamentous hemagglutinin N-terminal domain-containing protein [Campylobacteraceae bacterium]
MFFNSYQHSYCVITPLAKVFRLSLVGYLVLCVSLLNAAPTGGVVTNGNAQIIKNGVITDINQQSQKASINWQGFGIAPSETVNFNQPNSNALTLNRVIGNERSVIEGALNANGKVFIINSNGVLFTKGSSVNTAGLVASTLDISDENFNSNNFVFNSAISSENSVINLGTIKVADGGYIALLGEKVANEGVLIANKGTVALNSGDKITLNFNGNS